ncbi:MAG: hypothetical protein NVS3B26_14370 [Mycobacteriales bacterium]
MLMVDLGPLTSFFRDLLIISPQVVGGLWVAAALALVLARRWHRHRRSAALAALLSCMVLLPAAAADAVNAHFQYLPRVADVVNVPTWPTAPRSALMTALTASTRRTYPRGAVLEIPIPGRVSGFGVHTALAYLPPQYFTEPARRFPVVYLIHGSPGAPVDWFRAARAADAGLAAARAGRPVVLVAPRASRYWSDDSECVDRPGEHIETYLSQDVPQVIDQRLRTRADRGHRVLAGNSAGGYCALNLGLRHRGMFSVVLDLSGYDGPTYDGGLARLFGSRRHLAARVAANTPALYVRQLAVHPRMSLWLDYGRADARPRRDAVRMARLLRAAGQDVVVRERAGGHVYGVWRPALRESLLWAAAKVTGRAGIR